MTLRRKLLTTSVLAAIAIAGTSAAQAADAAAQNTTGDQQTTSATADAAAQKQAKVKQLQAVVVTGTHIPDADIATAQPITTLSLHDIQASGQVAVGDILQQLPSVSLSPLNRQSVNDGHPQEGGAFVNLRNLGASRTLVLVNGHRWAQTRDGETDLSSIPSSVIGSIQVLKDGASAVYGSDAIAGVVNILTKERFQGMQADVYYGANGKGDGINKRYSLTMGSVTDKNTFLMDVSQTTQGVMWARTRALTRYPRGPYHPTSGFSIATPAGKFALLDAQGNPTSVYALNALGDDATNIANYHLYTGNPSDQFNTKLDGMARLPISAKSLFARESYDFTPNLSFDLTAAYTQRRSTIQGAGAGLTTSSFPDNISGLISGQSIYNPVGQDVAFYTRLPSFPSLRRNTSDTKHIDGGLNGFFSIGEQDWNWSVNADYNADTYNIDRINGLNLANVHNALGPSFIGADGTAQCGTPDNVISGCTPWNVLAGPSAMSPALQQYFGVNATWRQFTNSKSYTANIAGGLFKIPFGGNVAAAFGVERRDESIRTALDPLVLSGVTTFSPQQPTQGSYGVNAAYYEISVPLLEDLPAARRLAFDFAGRYSRYSTFGGTFNGKYSFTWQPFHDLLFRGGFAQAFRSPSLNDMFGGSSRFSVFLLDPCDAKYGSQVYGTNVYNACVASLAKAAPGVNGATFRQLDGAGQPITTAAPIPPLLVDFASNPKLGPETSNSRTLGFVYSPSYVRDLNVGVEWYKTTIWNAVTLPDPNLIMQFCFQGDTASCTFTRNPTTGQLNSFAFGFMNLGKLISEGYDISLKYMLPQTRFGQFQVRALSTYLTKYGTQSAPGNPIQWAVGWTQSGIANWRMRSNLALDWQYHDIGATWTLRYFSSLRESCQFVTPAECNQPNHISPITGLSPTNRVGAIAFNDINFHAKLPWKGLVTVGINNLFDRQPPLTYSSLSNSGSGPVQGAYDLDRYMYVSYQQSF